MSSAYSTGWDAGFDNKGKNPFPKDSTEAAEWQEGFDEGRTEASADTFVPAARVQAKPKMQERRAV